MSVMMHWHSTWSWAEWLALSVAMVLLWSMIVGAAVALVRSSRGRNMSGSSSGDDARRTLDLRFAGGEITEEEYTRRGQLMDTR